jgi:hypothetical protein
VLEYIKAVISGKLEERKREDEATLNSGTSRNSIKLEIFSYLTSHLYVRFPIPEASDSSKAASDSNQAAMTISYLLAAGFLLLFMTAMIRWLKFSGEWMRGNKIWVVVSFLSLAAIPAFVYLFNDQVVAFFNHFVVYLVKTFGEQNSPPGLLAVLAVDLFRGWWATAMALAAMGFSIRAQLKPQKESSRRDESRPGSLSRLEGFWGDILVILGRVILLIVVVLLLRRMSGIALWPQRASRLGQTLNSKILERNSIHLDSTSKVSFENDLATPRRWKAGIAPLFRKQGSFDPV